FSVSSTTLTGSITSAGSTVSSTSGSTYFLFLFITGCRDPSRRVFGFLLCFKIFFITPQVLRYLRYAPKCLFAHVPFDRPRPVSLPTVLETPVAGKWLPTRWRPLHQPHGRTRIGYGSHP